LVITPPLPFYRTEEFDIDLEAMTRFWFLISLPTGRMRSISLILRKTIELKPFEDPINSRSADLNVMISKKIHRDLFGTKMIRLAEI